MVVETAAQMGMDEQTIAQYKAWALANSFSSLATMDETTSSNAMAIDMYVNAKAVNAGHRHRRCGDLCLPGRYF